MEPSQLDNVVLSLLFASDEPLSTKRLSAIVKDVEPGDLTASVARVEKRLADEFPSIVLERVAGGLQLATNPEYAEYVSQLYAGKRKQRLTRAGMETIAIIAYKQPITRADVENVRGVSCGGVLTTLMERGLIRIAGKAKVLGAPFLYGTTPEFLEYLGLDRLKDLPSVEELEAMLEQEESAQAERDGDGGAEQGSEVPNAASLGPSDLTEDEATAHAPPDEESVARPVADPAPGGNGDPVPQSDTPD